MLELVTKFVVTDAKTHVMGLIDQNLLVDELLCRLAGEERKQHGSLGAATGKLLLHHGAGLALHICGRNLQVATVATTPRVTCSPIPTPLPKPGTSVITMPAQIMTRIDPSTIFKVGPAFCRTLIMFG